MIVADASAVAAFLLPDEAGEFADFARETCRTNILHVPSHWAIELANVIWKARRRKRIGADDFARISQTASVVASTTRIAREISIADLVPIATETDLTPYDASYLMLARTLGAALLTRDRKLADAAASYGVAVLTP